MFIELQHVIAISGDIVRGTRESHQEEAEHGALEPEVRVEREGDTCQGRAQQQLHGQYPPALRLTQVDKRAPEGLDNPRQAQPTRIQTYLGIGQSHLHVKHHSDRCHNHIRQSLCHIERRYPRPGITFIHHISIFRF